MSVEQTWGHFFKPEVRNRGNEELARDLVFIANASDTQIQGSVRASTPARVTLRASSIASPRFTADCTCSASAKGIFCKHIWAVLKATEKSHPDFLSSKTILEKADVVEKPVSPHKVKQDAYKKMQSEKQKLRAKEQRREQKRKLKGDSGPQLPEEVTEALAFFAVNGFEFTVPFEEDDLKNAKKTLARVFHPDKGGSHEEGVVLNSQYEVLLRFLNS
jgi:hypothetical protein